MFSPRWQICLSVHSVLNRNSSVKGQNVKIHLVYDVVLIIKVADVSRNLLSPISGPYQHGVTSQFWIFIDTAVNTSHLTQTWYLKCRPTKLGIFHSGTFTPSYRVNIGTCFWSAKEAVTWSLPLYSIYYWVIENLEVYLHVFYNISRHEV